MMKIYTKQGDHGETGLFGGIRVPKDHLRIRSYGTLDELNSILGMVISSMEREEAEVGRFLEFKGRLLRIQGELFQLGTELATPRGKNPGIELLSKDRVESLEQEIDAMEESLPSLKTFILPGGARLAAELHLARTVSRRAEREVVALHRTEAQRDEVMQFMNRLSDYFFVCARFANHLLGRDDASWVAPRIQATKLDPSQAGQS
jgi:cob(I)alamin adenosyltransferase